MLTAVGAKLHYTETGRILLAASADHHVFQENRAANDCRKMLAEVVNKEVDNKDNCL